MSRVLLLSEADVGRLLPMSLALESVEAVFRWERVRGPGEIVSGKMPGRPTPEAITLFESQGLAMEDVAVGARVLERARAQGIGREIAFGD